MAVVLLLTTDNGQTIEFPILQKCIIGRSSNCDLTLEDKQMSGKHGVFEFNKEGHLLYSDLGSTNGSFLNNSQIQKIQFKVNEILRLGNTIITIDDKRLNARERLAIGRSNPTNDDQTIVVPAHMGTKSIVASSAPIHENENQQAQKNEASAPKRAVTLNKELKKKIPSSDWMAAKKGSVLEQEASSGKTKFLKLDINKHKKKK